MGSFVPDKSKPKLDSFELQQKYDLNQPVWKFLVSTHEVICHAGPLHLPEEEAISVIKPLLSLLPKMMS